MGSKVFAAFATLLIVLSPVATTANASVLSTSVDIEHERAGLDVQTGAIQSTLGSLGDALGERVDGLVGGVESSTTRDIDLTVTDVSLDPSNPDAGDVTDICATIYNDGSETAESVEVRGYVDGELAATFVTQTVGPGETEPAACTGHHEFEPGAHTVTVKVDPDDHKDETDETNNEKSTTITVEGSYGSVRGTVVGEDGNPVSGARVYFSHPEISGTRTDANGEYAFSDVPTGEYDVEVVAGCEYDSATRRVDVTEGGTAMAEFTLDRVTYDIQLDSEPVDAYLSGGGTFGCLEETTLEAPETVDGYEFQEWQASDGQTFSTDAVETITVNADRDLTAVYAQPGKPDLELEDVEVSPSSPDEGESTTITAAVANTGESRANGADLRVTAGSNIFDHDGIYLDPGERVDVEFDWRADEDTDEVEAEIDYNDRVDEEDETNNRDVERISVADRKPNLIVTSIRSDPATPEDGDRVDFDVQVENVGDAAADDFGTRLNVGGETFSETNIDLGAGDARTISLGSWRATSNVDSASAEVDFRDSVDERDEADNTETADLTVANSQSNLRVTDIEWRPSDPAVDEPVEFRATVENTGDARAADVPVRISANGRSVDFPTSVSVSAGETERTEWMGSQSFESGTHDIVAVADPDDRIDETDETDNRATETLAIDSTTGSVSGRVTDTDGEAVAGVRVYLGPRTETRTDSEGHYSFSDVDAGEYELEVVAGACYDSHTRTVDLDAGDAVTENVQLAAASYTVRLDSAPVDVHTQGEGVYDCGTTVDVSAPETSDEYVFSHWETRDGERVRDTASFTLSYLTNDYDLVAQYERSGRPDLTVTDVTWQPTEPAGDDTVAVRYTVTNDGTAPADESQAVINVAGETMDTTTVRELEPGEATTTAWIDVGTLDTGDHEVAVEADAGDVIDEDDESNNRQTERLVVSDAVGRIDGTVTDGDGDPIEDAAVTLGDTTVRTDWSGEYVFTEVAAGDRVLEVSADRYETVTRRTTVVADETVTEDLTLGAATYAVRLGSEPVSATLDGSGEYEAGSDVTVSAPSTLDSYQFEGWYTTDGDVYAAEREFVIEEIDREYDLVARYSERKQANLAVSEVDMPSTLQQGDSAEIAVEVSNTGERDIEQAELELTVGDRTFSDVVDLAAARSETYTFEWTATADASTATAMVDPANEIDESEESDNQLTDTVEVASPTLTPVQGGTVVVAVDEGDLSRVDDYTATVWVDGDAREKRLGSDGQATFERVPAGDHFLAVESADGAFDQRFRREVDTGAETTVEVDVPSLLQVNGQVQAKGGEPVEGVVVEIDGRTTATDENGMYTFDSRFQPDHYVATVYESDSRETILWQHQITFETDDTDRNIVLEQSESDLESQDLVTAGINSIPEEFVSGFLLGNTGVKYNFPGARTEGYAFTSGFKYGVAGKLVEEGESLAALLETDPMKTVDALVRLGNAFLDEPIGTSAELGEATVEGIKDDAWNVPAEDRRAMNPYDDRGLQQTFQVGYDSGYRSTAMTLYVVPISKIAKGSKVSKGLTKLNLDKFSKGLSKVSPDVRENIRGKVRTYTERSDVDVSTYLSETGDAGGKVLDKISEQTGTQLLRRYSAGDLDSSHIRRFNTRFEEGDIDQSDFERTLEILDKRSQNPQISEDVTPDTLLYIAEQGDVSDILAVTKPDSPGTVNGKTVDKIWLEEGQLDSETVDSDTWVHDDGGAGWKHIQNNRLNDKGRINQFKQKYGDSYEDPEEVKQLLYEAVNKGDPKVVTRSEGQDGLFYVYEVPDTGGERVSVLVGDNGFIVSAIPSDVT